MKISQKTEYKLYSLFVETFGLGHYNEYIDWVSFNYGSVGLAPSSEGIIESIEFISPETELMFS